MFTHDNEIFVMNSDGSAKRQLTFNTPGADITPVESPDGKYIAFSGMRNDGAEVWVMNADGTGQKQLTTTPRVKAEPRPTPAGVPTFFDTLPPKMRKMEKELPGWIQNPEHRNKADEASALVQKLQEDIKADQFDAAEVVLDSILKMMGLNPQEVVRDAPKMSEITASMHPTWSADGKRLAYASTRSGTTQIWVMNSDGSGQTQLTHGLGGRFPDANVPCWSLDGKLITFWAGYEHKYGDVWVMDPDGKNPRRITHTQPPVNSDDPRWAPDATKIIYGCGSPGKRDMYVVDVKSGTVRPFAKGIQWCDWQPAATRHESGSGAADAPTPADSQAPHYLLFWRTPDQAPELIKSIGEQGDGRTRFLGFGVPCATFAQEKQVPENIHRAFGVARRSGLALMLHFDFHLAWSNRPDLWNWFDPKQPGFNPDNRRNVEWFGWDGPPAKARYLNHGEAQRMPPPMCFTSKAIRAEWTRLIRDVIAPPLKEELAALEREGKGRLFAGVLVGSEPTFDSYSHTDPETAKQVAADGAPTGQLGYRALLDRGYSNGHPPADIHQALGEVIQETVAFWCKEFVQAGLSSQKLYPHIPAGIPLEATSAPVGAAFNAWSRPGWSDYPVGYLAKNFQPLYEALKLHGNPPWGGVEANVGMPGTLVDWETYLGWQYNHGAVLVAMNMGATGTDLPAQLEKSAFSPEALAAYHKFLHGEKLIEKPISENPQPMRIQRKLQMLQAGFHAWQGAGRDPAPIAHFVEDNLPALLRANKLEEAEALIDQALKRLSERTAVTPQYRRHVHPAAPIDVDANVWEKILGGRAQVEIERRPLARVALAGDIPAMALDDALDIGQADPGSRVFGCAVEALERLK